MSEHSYNKNLKSNTQTSWFERQSNKDDTKIINKGNYRQESRVKQEYNMLSPNVNNEDVEVTLNNRHGVSQNKIRAAVSPTRSMIKKDKENYKVTSAQTSKFMELKTNAGRLTRDEGKHFEST